MEQVGTDPVAAGQTTEHPVWQSLLTARRAQLNAVLARARAAGAAPEALRAALREVGASVDYLALQVPRPALDALTPVLVESVCELVVAKTWTERSAQRWAVLAVLPVMPVAVVRSPRTLLQLITTGAARLAHATDLAAWGRRLSAADPFLTSDDDLRHAATLAAWRSGFVRSRNAALQVAPSLPDDALATVLDLSRPESAREALAANVADPFVWPHHAVMGTLASYGGHRGLGGPWTSVPRVLCAQEADTPTWVVRTDEGDWALVADAHGHALLRLPEPRDARDSRDSPGDVTGSALAHTLTWADVVTGAFRAIRPQAGAARAGVAPAGTMPAGAIPAGSTAAGPAPAGPALLPPVLVSRRTSFRLNLVRVP